MINELDIVQGIYSILEEIGDSLPSEKVIDTKELLEHNDWGEALDLLCTQLYEWIGYEHSLDKSNMYSVI